MDRIGRGLCTTAMVLLAALLAWAPVPLGSNRPWAWSLLAVWAGVALAFWALGQALAPARLKLPRVVGVAAATTVAAWGWAFLQTIPAGTLPWLEAAPFWGEAAAAGVEGGTPSVGLDRAGSLDALMRLLGYAAVFWLAFALGQDTGRARRLLLVVLAATTACAGYGLLNYFTGWETIWWEAKTAYVGDVTGTFVNRNSFATYANLGLLVGVALLAEPFLAARSADDWRRIAVQAIEQLFGRRTVLVLALIVLATASLQSHSRGGLLSGAVALAFLLLLSFLATRPRPVVGLAVLAVALGAGWGILQVSGGVTLERLEQTDATGSGRLPMWEVSLDMVRERPWQGHGYGNFEAAFAQRRDEASPSLIVDKAHNTYIEHLVELGVPATVLLYVGPVLLFGYAVRGVMVRRRNQALALAGAAAAVLVGLHALVDFSLQIPAVAVTFAALLGVGTAQAIPSSRRGPRHGARLRDEA